MNNEEKILQMLTELSKGQAEMRSDIAELKTTQAEQGKQLAEQGKQLAEQGEALGRLETTVNEIDQRSARTQILLETDYADKLQLLFDGHELIKEKLEGLDTTSRVEALENDIVVLKDAFRLMRQEIAELKRAQ